LPYKPPNVRPGRCRTGRQADVQRKEIAMAETVYRVIDVIGTSTESWEKAAAAAITTASKSLRDLRVARVVEQDIHVEPRKPLTYRINWAPSFKYEGTVCARRAGGGRRGGGRPPPPPLLLTVMQLAPFLEHAHTLARLCRHPQLPRERVQQFQNRKLRFLVRHAYGRVEYYRQLFDRAGIRPDAIRSAADLAALPISTKSDFRARPLDDLVARGVRADRLILRYTAGSTGEPTRVRRTEFEDYLLGMFRARTQRLLGRQLRDRLVSVTSRGVPTDRKPTSLMRLSERIGVWRYLQLDCLRPLDELARDVARVAPDVLAGYPGVLSGLARLWPLLAERTTGPRLILIGGEVPTAAMRESIGRGFQAPVFNLYGSHEFNLLGWECPVTGDMHVCDDNVIIEVLQDGQPVRPNEPGDVVVTGL